MYTFKEQLTKNRTFYSLSWTHCTWRNCPLIGDNDYHFIKKRSILLLAKEDIQVVQWVSEVPSLVEIAWHKCSSAVPFALAD